VMLNLANISAMPTGPEETVVISKWLVHRDAIEGVDYDVESLAAVWMKTNLQDLDPCETKQRGVNSLGYVPGPYSEDAESLVMRFVDRYCNEVRTYLDRRVGDGQLVHMRPRLASGAAGGSRGS